MLFLNSYKAVNFSVFKQTPFQRKQTLINIRCGQLVGVDKTHEYTEQARRVRSVYAENAMYMFLNNILTTFFKNDKCFLVGFMERFLNVLRTCREGYAEILKFPKKNVL